MALEAYYKESLTRRGRLWAPDLAKAEKWTAMKAPLLLAVPLVLFRAIREEEKPMIPPKIRGLAMATIIEAVDMAKATVDWDLILSWCILAAQQDTNGNSFPGLPKGAVTEGEDKYFKILINQWLGATFGPRPSTGLTWNASMWGALTHMTQQKCQQ